MLRLMERRRLVRVPASLGQPRARASTARRRARAAPRARGARRPARFAVETDLRDRAATAATSSCARFERLHPPDGFTFRDPLRHPARPAGWGRAPPPIVAGLMAADHLFELDADVLALATRARGPSRQRRRRAARRLRRSAPTARRALRRRRPGSRPCSSCPHEPVRTAEARAALPAEVPMADAVFNVGARALLTLGPRARRLGPRRRRARRPPAPAAPRPPLPALAGAGRARARARRARRDDLRRRPDRARVDPLRADRGRSLEGLRRAAGGWADVIRVPFEPQGADVRTIT